MSGRPSVLSAVVVVAALVSFTVGSCLQAEPASASEDTLIVADNGPYRSIAEALAAARDGQTIEVHGGIHHGPIVVDRSVKLIGIGAPVLDGHGKGTVILLAAPDTILKGFVVRSSGADLNANDAGVGVAAARVVVEENQLEDVLNGVSLDNAPDGVIRNNRISGKPLEVPFRGDGIRLWYSSNVLIQGNEVTATRDCVIWYSSGVRVAGNRIEQGRYGIHFMNDDRAEVVGNVLRQNSVGAYLMYSRDVTVRENLFASNRGPSGFGLGLKEVDNLVLESNWLVDNRVGAWMDTSPRSLSASNRVRGNVFALNDIGLSLTNIQRNSFWENIFRDNAQQVSVVGGGISRGNQWALAGRGNYWSDYRGFDANGDGVGDMPHRVEALFGELMDRRPELRVFQYGLAASAIDFVAHAFPTFRPAPKLADDAPLVVPPPVAAPPGLSTGDSRGAYSIGIGLLGVAIGILGLTRVRVGQAGSTVQARAVDGPPQPEPIPIGRVSRTDLTPDLHNSLARGQRRLEHNSEPGQEPPVSSDTRSRVPALRVTHLTKRYGRLVAVDGLDLAVAPGESVALWGPNGAGKTTVVKCILGLVPFSGAVAVAGHDVGRRGKASRLTLGYVPQEVAFYDDLTVGETVALFARLKRLTQPQMWESLRLLGLADHDRKLVGALSGGMRQRLALAIALAGNPSLLVLDEPTSNLDASGREQAIDLLREQRARGAAIVFASHRLEEIEGLADRVVVLERGRLAFTCPATEFSRRIGLQLSMKIRVASGDRDVAVRVLRGAGLTSNLNGGSTICVKVQPAEKVFPIRILEQAGIVVADFAFEDGATAKKSSEGN